MYTIMIADDNTDWLDIVCQAVSQDPAFEIVASATDGVQAIEQIDKHRPDIIVLDIIMPKADGIFIVNHIRAMRDYSPMIYMLTGIGTDSIIKILNELGIAFYSMKPISVELILRNLHKLIDVQVASKRQDRDASEEKILSTLYKLGLPPSSRNTHYIKFAIMLYLEKLDDPYALTKVIYPQIAKKYSVTPASVERSMRYSISKLQDCKTELYKQIFELSSSYSNTNREFFAFVAEYISNS